jgi:hypothetical protein
VDVAPAKSFEVSPLLKREKVPKVSSILEKLAVSSSWEELVIVPSISEVLM